MPDEDQNIGVLEPEQTTTAVETTEIPTSSNEQVTDTPGTTGDTEGNNQLAEALNAFEAQKSGIAPVARGSEQTQSGLANTQIRPQGFQRTFEGLDPEEQRMFKDMSTPAYKKLYPLYLEARKQKEEIETLKSQATQAQQTSFYDQDGAWRITPEYSQLSQTVQQLNGEVDFWTQQLESLEEGGKAIVLTGYDQNGRPQYSEPLESSPRLKAVISGALSKAHSLALHHGDKLANYEQSFKEKYSSHKDTIKSLRSKIFTGVDLAKLEAAASKKLSIFPEYLRGRDEYKTVAECLVVIDGLVAMNRKLQSKGVTNGIKQGIVNSAGPAADAIKPNGGGGEGSVKDILSQFARAKQGLV